MPKIVYEGIEFDSQEEMLFYLYLEELKEKGFVKDYSYHTNSFILSEKVVFKWKKSLKTKDKEMESTLLQGHMYTPDFLIHWNPKAYGIFYVDIDDGDIKLDKVPFINNIYNDGTCAGSYIEIKPSFDMHNMTRLVTINIKWVYEKYGILVQIIKPLSKNKCLFERTFVPQKAMFTPKTKKPKKYKFDSKSLDDYLKTKGV